MALGVGPDYLLQPAQFYRAPLASPTSFADSAPQFLPPTPVASPFSFPLSVLPTAHTRRVIDSSHRGRPSSLGRSLGRAPRAGRLAPGRSVSRAAGHQPVRRGPSPTFACWQSFKTRCSILAAAWPQVCSSRILGDQETKPIRSISCLI